MIELGIIQSQIPNKKWEFITVSTGDMTADLPRIDDDYVENSAMAELILEDTYPAKEHSLGTTCVVFDDGYAGNYYLFEVQLV